jgi:hypothetical protein
MNKRETYKQAIDWTRDFENDNHDRLYKITTCEMMARFAEHYHKEQMQGLILSDEEILLRAISYTNTRLFVKGVEVGLQEYCKIIKSKLER